MADIQPTPSDDMPTEDKWGLAIAALAPALFGGLMGGKQGALAGGAQGFGAVGGALKDKAAEDEKAKATAEAEAKTWDKFKKQEDYKSAQKPPKEAKTPARQEYEADDGSKKLGVIDNVTGHLVKSAGDEVVAKPQPEKAAPLPIEDVAVIKPLATSNANKISIANQIDAVMSKWDDMPEDQKIMAGRQLIKTLNSTQGQDAVGNQEREVLGSKIENAFGNFTNGNPTQFGRDLEGFAEQAKNVSGSLRSAISANDEEIARRKTHDSSGPKDAPKYSKEQQAAAAAELEKRRKAK